MRQDILALEQKNALRRIEKLKKREKLAKLGTLRWFSKKRSRRM